MLYIVLQYVIQSMKKRERERDTSLDITILFFFVKYFFNDISNTIIYMN